VAALFWQRCRGDDHSALGGYSNALQALRFSPDGDTLATRSRDHQVKVWDLATRTERFTITNVTRLGQFTTDGQTFVCGTEDGSVTFCETRTGRPVRSLHQAGELVALLADGNTVATTGADFIVNLWDIASGRETFVMPGKGGSDLWGPEFGAGVVITPDGKRLAISNGFQRGLTLWDLSKHEIVNGALDQRPTPLTFLELSPGGNILATGSFDGRVRFWDMTTGAELPPALQAHAESVVSAAFSLEGRVLATASLDQTIKLWEFATRRELDTLRGHADGVMTLAFAADGRRLASGGQDKTVRLWHTVPRLVKPAISGLAEGYPLIWSPDSKLLAGCCTNETVQVWDAGTMEARSVLPGGTRVLAFSDHGDTILARFADGTVRYSDVATGKVTREGPGAPLDGWTCVVISPDRRSAAITDGTATIQLWDMTSGEIGLLMGPTRTETALAFSPDRRTLICGGANGVMDVWDVQRRQHLVSLAAHPDARVLSGAISPDGMMAASGGTDNTIRLWNLDTGTRLAPLNGHKRPVWALAFSPDGKTLASGSGDRSVRLWDVALRREVAILRRLTRRTSVLPEEIRALSFSPDGNNLAAVTQGGDVMLFRAAPLADVTAPTDATPAQPRAAE
jgi:WD40 repeat protein